MKISSIGYGERSFKGILAEVKEIVVPNNCHVTDTTGKKLGISEDTLTKLKIYYPFSDETEEQIFEFVTANTKRETIKNYAQNFTRHIIERVRVQKTLPFSSSDWSTYIKNKFKLKPAIRIKIERTLERINMKNFIR